MQKIFFYTGILLGIIGIVLIILKPHAESPKDENLTLHNLLCHSRESGNLYKKDRWIPACAGMTAGKMSEKKETIVVKVLDGDTIVTQDGKTIRYVGINTAEKGEAYADKAGAVNKQLVLGKTIQLEFDKEKKDRYGRLLAYVFVDTIFVNEEIIKQGLAIPYFLQNNMTYEKRLTDAQTYARTHCFGMWEGLCETTIAAQCIRIPSLQYDAPGVDDKKKNEEWIVIENMCDKKISLYNWLLKDTSASNRYTFNNYFLASGSHVRLHSGCGKDTQEDLFWQCPEVDYAIWNNTHDQAFLFDEKGKLVTEYAY